MESHGGSQIVIIGHRGISGMYKRLGFQSLGLSTQSGALIYDLLLGSVAQLRAKSDEKEKILDKFFDQADWQLPVPFNPHRSLGYITPNEYAQDEVGEEAQGQCRALGRATPSLRPSIDLLYDNEQITNPSRLTKALDQFG